MNSGKLIFSVTRTGVPPGYCLSVFPIAVHEQNYIPRLHGDKEH